MATSPTSPPSLVDAVFVGVATLRRHRARGPASPLPTTAWSPPRWRTRVVAPLPPPPSPRPASGSARPSSAPSATTPTVAPSSRGSWTRGSTSAGSPSSRGSRRRPASSSSTGSATAGPSATGRHRASTSPPGRPHRLEPGRPCRPRGLGAGRRGRARSARASCSRVDAGNPIPGFTPRGVGPLRADRRGAAPHLRRGPRGPRPPRPGRRRGLRRRRRDRRRPRLVRADRHGRDAPQRRRIRPTILSTLGAGDVFHGALVAAVVQGLPLDQQLAFANVTAALSCRGLDGRSRIPSLAEVEAAMPANAH